MGNTSGKSVKKHNFLSKDETQIVGGLFKHISKNSDQIKKEDLMKLWGSQMDPRLAQYIANFLCGTLPNRSEVVQIERFSELYVYCIRGTIDDRINMLLSSLGQNSAETTEVDYPLIKEYVEAIVSSYMRAIRLGAFPAYKSWDEKKFQIMNENVQKLAENLAYEAVQQGTQKVSISDIERWIQCNPTFIKMLEYVFHHLYNIRLRADTAKDHAAVHRQNEWMNRHCLLPMCTDYHNVEKLPEHTDIAQILFINSNLPMGLQAKWRFLFSSRMHGESFSTMLGRILAQGPTVLLIEDSNGFVFGSFSAESWSLGPNFAGNETSFLFTIKPKMRIFSSTGYNDHYQYLNLYQQTMPNGLGIGGQFNYWGLWLDSEYGIGHSAESCTTYKNYIQLSSAKDFKIKRLEIWGIGDKPKPNEDDGPQSASVLDGNLEEQVMLEMAGKGRVSQGYRDEPLDLQ